MDSAEKKAAVTDFLNRCNRYAEAELAKYRQQLVTADAGAALAIQDKIGHWTAYRAFNAHALAEIGRGELDDWFESPP
jgi:hypothetical protein